MRHLIIRTSDAFTGQSNLNDDIHFWQDGRWSPATTRREMIRAIADVNAQRASRGLRPIQALDYRVLGESDYSTYELPFVPSREFSWRDDESGATVVRYDSGSGWSRRACIDVYNARGERAGSVFSVSETGERGDHRIECRYTNRYGTQLREAGLWRNSVFETVIRKLAGVVA